MYRRRCGHNRGFFIDDHGPASFDYGRHDDELGDDDNDYYNDHDDNHITANAVRRSR